MRKKIFIVILPVVLVLALLAGVIIAPKAKSQITPYYSGEAVNFNNEIYIGSTNTGFFELFKLIDNRIARVGTIFSKDPANSYFLDTELSKENGRLYVYLVNGTYIYKYRMNYDMSLELIKRAEDNSGEYIFGISKFGDNIITIDKKGIKVWNSDLVITNSFKDEVNFSDNLAFSENGNYFFNIYFEYFAIVESFYRNIINGADLNTNDFHARRPYFDNIEGAVYLVDDSRLQKYYLDSGIAAEFNHISDLGYDVDGLDGRSYIYFSDGIGIVKNRKSDLRPEDWVFTTDIGPGNGWAMGLRAVEYGSGEAVIVFNGSSILAFDDQLSLIDYYGAREIGDYEDGFNYEPLYLNINKNWGFPGSYVNLNGGGFNSNEELEILFLDDKYYAKTDENGRFSIDLRVLPVKPGLTDIKVNGLISGLTYSISFYVN